MNTEDLRCYWCNRSGAGNESYGGCIKNDIVFCWQSTLCPFETCGEILKKIDTIVDDFECPVCLENKKALEMPQCNHKVCLDCYKAIYFGKSEYEKTDCPNLPEWTYELQMDEEGEIIDNEKENEHYKFLREKINYSYEEEERTYEELIELRNNLLHERPEWMNNIEVINYENELFRIFSEYRIKEDIYYLNLTIGNQSCPLCRKHIEY
jgi:hypothetical protein